MNIVFHCFFGILATAFFIWRYVQVREPYQLLLTIWIPSTFLTYVSENHIYTVCLSIAQLILFDAFLFLFLRSRKRREEQQRQRETLRKRLHELEQECRESDPEAHEEEVKSLDTKEKEA